MTKSNKSWVRLGPSSAAQRLRELQARMATSKPTHANRLGLMAEMLDQADTPSAGGPASGAAGEYSLDEINQLLWPADSGAAVKFKDLQRAVAEVSGEPPLVPAKLARSQARGTWSVEGEDPVEEALAQVSKAAAGLEFRTSEPARSRATATYETYPALRVCVDWHPEDTNLARTFTKQLHSALGAALGPTQLDLVTTDIHEAGATTRGRSVEEYRRAQYESAEVVVVLVSDSALNQHPLGVALAAELDTPVVPVALTPIDEEVADRWSVVHFVDDRNNPKTYADLQRKRPEFVRSIAKTVIALGKSSRPPEVGDEQFRTVEREGKPTLVVSYGNLGVLRSAGEGRASAEAHEEFLRALDEGATTRGVVVIETLQRWARAELASPQDIELARKVAGERKRTPDASAKKLEYRAPTHFVIFGEYGMGKTTWCRELTFQLFEARQGGDTAAPLPIYLDLRLVGRLKRKHIKLETVIERVLARSWTRSDIPAPTAEMVLDKVRNQGAVIIFDGLDEVMVHLDDQGARTFAQELWRALPPETITKDNTRAVAGKVLLSCRTHFFRDVTAQHGYLTGDLRDSFGDYRFESLHLLPFGEAQIKSYLENALAHSPTLNARNAFERMKAVHNLEDMASRPRNLALITDQLHEIEELHRQGKRVMATTIYGLLVRRWLQFDAPKHQVAEVDKPVLMEELAAHMWALGATSVHVDELERWVRGQLDQGCLAQWWKLIGGKRSRTTLDQVQEDVRDACFVVRPGDEHFQFAHTSLFEYFLARWMLRQLLAGTATSTWTKRPSRETVEFLAELASDPEVSTRSRVALKKFAAVYRPELSEMAFGVAIGMAQLTEIPGSELLSGWDLRGADLDGLELRPPAGARWQVSGLRLDRARLRKALFHGLDLRSCSFGEARLAMAELVDCVLSGCSFEGTDLRGVGWHRSTSDNPHVDGIPSGSRWAGLPTRKPKGTARLSVGEGHRRDFHPTDFDGRGSFEFIGGVLSVGFDSDGGRVVSGGADGTVRVWDSVTGEQLVQLDGHGGPVRWVGFDSDGARVVSGSSDGTVRVWDSVTGEQLVQLEGHRGRVLSVRFDSDSARVVSGGADGTVRVWDSVTGEQLVQLDGHRRAVWSVGFDSDGGRVVSGGSDGTVRVWDSVTGEQLSQLDSHGGDVLSVGFDSDGARVVSGGVDGRVRVWDSVTGEQLVQLVGHGGAVWSVGFDSDGARVVSGGADGTVRVWDSVTGEQLVQLVGHGGAVLSVGFDSDGARVVSGGADGTVRVWDSVTGEQLVQLDGHGGGVWSVGFDSDGARVASGSSDGTVRVWDSVTGEQLVQLEGHGGAVWSVGFDSDGARVVSGSSDGTVRVWDSVTGEQLLRLDGHRGAVWSVGFDSDGARVVSGGSDGTMRVWDSVTGEQLLRLDGHGGGVWSVGFDPDGARVVSGGADGTVRVWDSVTGEQLVQLVGHGGGVLSVGFDSDGGRVVSGGSDGAVRVWDSVTGEQLLRLVGHGGGVLSVGFDSDGGRVVSGGSDGAVRVWDSVTGEQLLRLDGHRRAVWSVGFDSDGARVVSGGADGTVRTWDSVTAAPQLCCWPLSGGRANGEWVVYKGSLPGKDAPFDPANMVWSPGAWRWVHLVGNDPHTNALTAYDVEALGPIRTVA